MTGQASVNKITNLSRRAFLATAAGIGRLAVSPGTTARIMSTATRWSIAAQIGHTPGPSGPSPGAMAAAFETLGLVAFTPIGPGIANRFRGGALDVLQPRPLTSIQAIPLQGLGGLVQGQFILQPLLVNQSPSYYDGDAAMIEPYEGLTQGI